MAASERKYPPERCSECRKPLSEGRVTVKITEFGAAHEDSEHWYCSHECADRGEDRRRERAV